MKTYQTWEIIKSLTEKTQQKFKLVGGCKNLNYIGFIASNYVGFLRIANKDENSLNLQNMGGIFLNGEWRLVQEPVTFLEAINSCKGIRFDGLCDYYTVEAILKDLSGSTVNGYLNKINGKWFIEEDNINE